MKRILAMILCAIMLLMSLAACGNAQKADDGVFVVGVCQIEPHAALDAATQGFKDALVAELGEDKVQFIDGNAAGDSNTLNTIIQDFVSKKVDLILANATPVLQTAAGATSVIPILGTSVTEYGVALQIDDFDGLVGGNISGTSDLAPLDKQAQMVLDWCPNAKKVGLLYSATEANSTYQVKVVKEYLEGKGVTCTEYSFSSSSDLAAVTEKAASESEAIYIPTDNTVANSAELVDSICRAKKVPVITGEENICKKCGIATLSISYYDLGATTGKMAAQVLTGQADISQMKIANAETQTAKYNAEICEDLGIEPLEGYVAIE